MDRRNPTAAKNALETDIRDALAGQGDALRNLVLRYQDLAVGYAFSLLGDYHLAEDAAQEALIAMVRNLGQLREPEAFVGWLRTIVFKQCDRIRRRRRTVEPVFPDDDRLVDDTESPDQARAIDELGALVQRAVAALPVAQREAVTLYYMSDMSGPEVAVFLGLPLSTIKKRLHDAKSTLKGGMAQMTEDFINENRPSRDAAFSERVLRVAAPDPDADAPLIYSLFEAEDHPSRREWRDGRLSDSHADWQVSRAAFVRENGTERLVGAVNAYDLGMRIGSAEVRAAGFNGEVLDADVPDPKNVLAAAYGDAVGAMRASGYDMAVTFDDTAFWLENGFALGWRACECRVATSDLPVAPIPQLDRFEAAHRDDLASVFNDSHAGLTASVRRPTYRRNKHPGLLGRHPPAYLPVVRRVSPRHVDHARSGLSLTVAAGGGVQPGLFVLPFGRHRRRPPRSIEGSATARPSRLPRAGQRPGGHERQALSIGFCAPRKPTCASCCRTCMRSPRWASGRTSR